MNQNAAQCRFLLFQAKSLLGDLDESHRAIEPVRGIKTAGWIIGHLAVTGDFARRLCGRPPICPSDWRAKFNPGSTPPTNASDYPAMTALRDAFFAVYEDLADVAPKTDASLLAKENPYVPAQRPFPTAGDFVAWMLSGHTAYHIGQLVAWRSAAGLDHVPHPGDFPTAK